MRDEKELNIEIFDLVNQVSKEPVSDKSNKIEKNNFIGDNEIARFKKTENHRSLIKDEYGNTVESYKNSFGLRKNSYRQLKLISNELIELKPYSEFATINFIENNLFNWIIDTYIQKSTKNDPIDYLRICFDEEFKDYIFYFRIKSLRITNTFKLGLVEFTFLDENFITQKIEQFRKDVPNSKKEEFQKFFEEFNSIPVIAKVYSKGIREKAEENAKIEVNLAIDSLKSFLILESINHGTKLLDVEYRFTEISSSLNIYETTSNEFDFIIQMNKNDGVKPVYLNSNQLKKLYESGLNIISDFISNKKNDQLYNIIIQMISNISTYSSERNHHERIVKIVSTYESVFIPENSSKGRGLTQIQKVLDKFIIENDKEIVKKIFRYFDKVRNSYIHNKVQKNIDPYDLLIVQDVMKSILLYLIELNKNIKTSKDLLSFFNIK